MINLEKLHYMKNVLKKFDETLKNFEDQCVKKFTDEVDLPDLDVYHQSNIKKLHPPTEEPDNNSTIPEDLEAERKLIMKDYREIHCFIKRQVEQVKNINKYFKEKIDTIKTLKTYNENKNLGEESLSFSNVSQKNTNISEMKNKTNSEEDESEDINSISDISSLSSDDIEKEAEHDNEDFKQNEYLCEEDIINYKKFHHNELRKGVLDMILSEKEKEDLLEYAKKGPNFSDSIKKQNRKVLELYKKFCKEMKLIPFPVTAITSVSFIHHLAKSGRYCVGTLDKIICYTLLRLNLIITHKPIDTYTTARMRSEIMSISKDKTVKQCSDGMTPLIVDDLRLIIERIPDIDPQKPKLASMFLFALSTGSRASTVAGIRLCHFKNYYNRQDAFGNFALTIQQEIRKSKKPNYKTVTISGVPNQKDSVNVIYWLEVYLKKSFNITISELVNYNRIKPNEKQDLLWPLKPDAMTQTLKRRAKYAGLNIEKIGMHSLRSGFLASAILNNEGNDEGLRGIMERAAAVADWEPYSKAQIVYIKATTRQAIVSTDLIGMSQTDKNGINNSKRTEIFHQITLSSPSTPITYNFLVKDELRKLIKVPNCYNKKNFKMFQGMYSYALNIYSKKILKNEELTYNQRRSIILKHINNNLKEKKDSIDNVASILYTILKLNNKLNVRFEDVEESKPVSFTTKRNERLKKLCGRTVKRARWSKSEDETLEECLKRRMNINEIAAELYFRNEKNIYDHLRSINKKRIAAGKDPFILPRAQRRRRTKLELLEKKQKEDLEEAEEEERKNEEREKEEEKEEKYEDKEALKKDNLNNSECYMIPKDKIERIEENHSEEVTSLKENISNYNSILNNNEENSTKSNNKSNIISNSIFDFSNRIITDSKCYNFNMFKNITDKYYNSLNNQSSYCSNNNRNDSISYTNNNNIIQRNAVDNNYYCGNYNNNNIINNMNTETNREGCIDNRSRSCIRNLPSFDSDKINYSNNNMLNVSSNNALKSNSMLFNNNLKFNNICSNVDFNNYNINPFYNNNINNNMFSCSYNNIDFYNRNNCIINNTVNNVECSVYNNEIIRRNNDIFNNCIYPINQNQINQISSFNYLNNSINITNSNVNSYDSSNNSNLSNINTRNNKSSFLNFNNNNYCSSL